jgi:molecular chaperone GrpE
MNQNDEVFEFEVDADSGDEIVAEESELSAAALKSKLKSLRKELLTTQQERDANLTGWQRAKADLVNFRRNVEEDRVRDTARQKGKIIQNILPALDSFESAMAGTAWNEVDTTWREGVERIRTQLLSALEREGVTSFGTPGEVFDPAQHECMSVTPTNDASHDHTIAHVLQKGYRIGTEVIRPAMVTVWQHNA